MKNLRLMVAVCASTLFLLTANAKAATLWNQPLDPSLSGHFSNFVTGATNAQVAEDFTLTEQSTLDGISWAGYYQQPLALADPVAFKIRFFDDAGGTSGIPIDSFFQEYDVTVNAIATGDIGVSPVGSGLVFSYSVSIPSLTLDQGKYWVAIAEADTRSVTGLLSQWLWSRSDPLGVGGFATRSGDLDTWGEARLQGNMALTLSGTTVPIPPAVWLFGSGLLGLVGIARRKKAA